MDDLNIKKLARLRAKMDGREKEFYKTLSLILPEQEKCLEVFADVVVRHGFFSNVGAQRLKQQFNQDLLMINGKIILTNACILCIKKELFLSRKDDLSIFNSMEIEGNIYHCKDYMYSLIFPIDLIIAKHIEIKKWNLL